MGRVNPQQGGSTNQTNNNQQDSQPQTLHHFSHIHPLRLVNIQILPPTLQIKCKACMHPCNNGQIYSCTPCNYILHPSCAKTPRTIQHPSHPGLGHTLTLSTTPTYQTGFFSCDACGKQGRSFSLHCTNCEFDLHIPCANLKSQVKHPSHPHPLALSFASPYGNTPFSCNICNKIEGGKVWLYHCGICEFDAHIECTTNPPNIRNQQQEMHDQLMANLTRYGEMQNQMVNQILSQYNNQGNPAVNEMLQNFAVMGLNNNNGGIGGGGGAPDFMAAFLQQMNNQGNQFGGGGGGDPTAALLDQMNGQGGMGFGAGGDDYTSAILQQMMNGGGSFGGAGLDPSTFGGLNGMGGGLDFSGFFM